MNRDWEIVDPDPPAEPPPDEGVNHTRVRQIMLDDRARHRAILRERMIAGIASIAVAFSLFHLATARGMLWPTLRASAALAVAVYVVIRSVRRSRTLNEERRRVMLARRSVDRSPSFEGLSDGRQAARALDEMTRADD